MSEIRNPPAVVDDQGAQGRADHQPQDAGVMGAAVTPSAARPQLPAKYRGLGTAEYWLPPEVFRRVVACIAACEAISTDLLESLGEGGLAHVAEASFEERMRRNRIPQERAALLMFARSVIEQADADPFMTVGHFVEHAGGDTHDIRRVVAICLRDDACQECGEKGDLLVEPDGKNLCRRCDERFNGVTSARIDLSADEEK